MSKQPRIISWSIVGVLAAIFTGCSGTEIPTQWDAKASWRPVEFHYLLEIASTTLPQQCNQHSSHYLHFPTTIETIHEVWVDNVLVLKRGDFQKHTSYSTYSRPKIPCEQIRNAKTVLWRALTYQQEFARELPLPVLSNRIPVYNLFAELGFVMAVAVFLAGLLYSGIIFQGRLTEFMLGNVLLIFYSVFNVPGLFGIEVSMSTSHRIADASMWLGGFFVFLTVYRFHLISRFSITFLGISVGVSVLMLALGNDNQLQLASSIPFVSIFVLIVDSLIRMGVALYRKKAIKASLFILPFYACIINDVVMVVLMADTVPLINSGFIFLVLFISLKNANIVKRTFRDREKVASELKKLVYSHQLVKIRDSGLILEQSMPLHPGKACTIVFDIISSSKFNHIESNDIFNQIFARCSAAMAKNYDPDLMCSDAFRVKELGDGFICSIGYPFAVPPEYASAVEATIQLTNEFYRIFIEVTQAHDLHEPLHCSMGCAYGKVQGFFPSEIPKTYDLYGDSIVKATRYENIRKVLFMHLGIDPTSVLVVQNTIWNSLPSKEREKFAAVDITKQTFKIRDDPEATEFYYKLFDEQQHQALIDTAA